MPKVSLCNYLAISSTGGPTVKAKSSRSQTQFEGGQLPFRFTFKLAHHKWIYLNSLNQNAHFCSVLLYLLILLFWEYCQWSDMKDLDYLSLDYMYIIPLYTLHILYLLSIITYR